MKQVDQTLLVVFRASLFSRNAPKSTAARMFLGALPAPRIPATKSRIMSTLTYLQGLIRFL